MYDRNKSVDPGCVSGGDVETTVCLFQEYAVRCPTDGYLAGEVVRMKHYGKEYTGPVAYSGTRINDIQVHVLKYQNVLLLVISPGPVI